MRGTEITDEQVNELVARVREATGALMRGEVRRYLELVDEAPDYTLMPPTGGPTRRREELTAETIAGLEAFFSGGGEGDLELEQTYTSGDLAVLVGVERQRGSLGGLPDQEWPLRVTLVFRHEDSGWRLVHRHADALVHPIDMALVSRLAAGRSDDADEPRA